VFVSRKLTFASYCFLQFNSATDILLYSACMYIPLGLKLSMHSIRKFLLHITVFSVIHSIALDKLSSDMQGLKYGVPHQHAVLGPEQAKLNVLGHMQSKSAVKKNAPIGLRMKGPNETWQQPELLHCCRVFWHVHMM
jgi:hypothetical protein